MNNAATAVGDISASLEQINLSVAAAKGHAEEGIRLYRSLPQDAA
ncbi:MAG: hypothetical protein ACFCVH_08640 [Alphaproteobacteria bacterium]